MPKKVVIVGSGAWGGWTAFHLQKAGCEVTLIDKEGPGNVLSGSGGKTRIIRMAYGGSEIYTNLTEQSFALWKKYGTEWNEQLYHQKEALWLFRDIKPSYAELSIPLMKERGFELRPLPVDSLIDQYPEMNFEDITSAYEEPHVAYLEASRACEVVKNKFVALGGKYVQTKVEQLKYTQDQISGLVTTTTGDLFEANQYVLACGPWLSQLVPEMAQILHISRQEVYYFEAPSKFYDLPIWVEFREGDQMFYGIPDHFGEGFKFAYDERTWSLDPESDHRGITPAILERMKGVLVNRFPELKDAIVLKHHTCVYESAADGNFIVDQIPNALNGLMLASSSGHGFKMGPAIGELVANHTLGRAQLPNEFSLSRLTTNQGRKSQYEV